MKTLLVGIVIGVAVGIFAWKWLELKLNELKRRREQESNSRISALQAENTRLSLDALNAGKGTRYLWNGRQIKATKDGETRVLDEAVTEHARRLAIAGNMDEAVIHLNRTLKMDFDEAKIVADLLIRKFP
jgi:hypothetical protein